MKYDRLEYLEKAFAEMGVCYDNVSARCIEAEANIKQLEKLVALIDQQGVDMWKDLQEMVKEIEAYPFEEINVSEVLACIKKYFPELEVKDE